MVQSSRTWIHAPPSLDAYIIISVKMSLVPGEDTESDEEIDTWPSTRCFDGRADKTKKVAPRLEKFPFSTVRILY